MIEVKSKSVCEVSSMESFYGLTPLCFYIPFVYFNYNEKNKNILLSLPELSKFITECLVEAATRESIDFRKLEIDAKDIYIGAVPTSTKETRKFLLFNHGSKTILISETKHFSQDGSKIETLKMKDIGKEGLLSLMLSVNNFSISLIDSMVSQCAVSKNVSFVGAEGDHEAEDDSDESNGDGIDLNDYEKL